MHGHVFQVPHLICSLRNAGPARRGTKHTCDIGSLSQVRLDPGGCDIPCRGYASTQLVSSIHEGTDGIGKRTQGAACSSAVMIVIRPYSRLRSWSPMLRPRLDPASGCNPHMKSHVHPVKMVLHYHKRTTLMCHIGWPAVPRRCRTSMHTRHGSIQTASNVYHGVHPF